MAIADMLQKRASQSLSMNELNQDRWSRQMANGSDNFFLVVRQGNSGILRSCLQVVRCDHMRSTFLMQLTGALSMCQPFSQRTRFAAHFNLLPSTTGQDAGCKKILKPLLKKHQVNLDLHFGLPLVNSMGWANVWCRAGDFSIWPPSEAMNTERKWTDDKCLTRFVCQEECCMNETFFVFVAGTCACRSAAWNNAQVHTFYPWCFLKYEYIYIYIFIFFFNM